MISSISGKIVTSSHGTIEIAVSEFITIEISVSQQLSIEKEKIYQFFIATLFNVEKGYQLYGFLTLSEKQYFLLLCQCQGIGPKLAQTILSFLSPDTIYHAIKNDNISLFEKINGIGNKKATHIMHELKKKDKKLPHPSNIITPASFYNDLILSLQSIGYNEHEIKKMIDNVQKTTWSEEITLVQLIQYAIKSL